MTVLDSKVTTLSDYYHELSAEFLPNKKIREWALPKWTVLPAAWLSSALSRETPLFDPTLYALDTMTHNLDFSNSRMKNWLQQIGEQEYESTSFA